MRTSTSRKIVAILLALSLIITLNFAMFGKLAWMWFWITAVIALVVLTVWKKPRKT